MIAVKLDAGHDSNGNPRRGWLIVTSEGTSTFVDEGYMGNGALHKAGFHFKGTRHLHPRDSVAVTEGPTLAITPGQYRDLMRAHKA